MDEFGGREVSLSEVQVLQLRDGDTLVFQPPVELTREQWKRVQEDLFGPLIKRLGERGACVELLILPKGCDLKVVRKESA